MFLLDTDHIGIVQRQTTPEFPRLLSRLKAHDPTVFYISIISFHEQVVGWNAYLNRARSPEAVVRAYEMFQNILRDFATMAVAPFKRCSFGTLSGTPRLQDSHWNNGLEDRRRRFGEQLDIIDSKHCRFFKSPGPKNRGLDILGVTQQIMLAESLRDRLPSPFNCGPDCYNDWQY